MLIVLTGAQGLAATQKVAAISEVRVSKAFFNPSLGETIGVSCKLLRPGVLTVRILDRDGFPVRTLTSGESVGGAFYWDWDGRDDRHALVADEAYSLKIDLVSEGQNSTYFPGNAPAQDISPPQSNYYDRRSGVLSYTLARPARVHIQAGTARMHKRTLRRDGPVMKTLVNREPRPAGAVIENWHGLDESGASYVPDLPDFVVAIAAVSLPDNAIIAFGNRNVGFLENAAARSGSSLLTRHVKRGAHHAGLSTLDDVAPRLKTEVRNATWSAKERIWKLDRPRVDLTVSLDGPSATAFARHPADLHIFLDEKELGLIHAPRPGMTVSLPLARAAAGVHTVSLNWVSAYGPVAVDAFRVDWTRGTGLPMASATR